MRIISLLFCCFILIPTSQAKKYPFEEILLSGVENPVSLTMSPDGLQLVLIDLQKKEGLSVKTCYRPYIESKWSAAVPVEALNQLIDKTSRIESPSFSYDMKSLYFAANFPDSKGGMDIYASPIKDGVIGKPENLGNWINTEADENGPSLSGNNRRFYFTREREMKKLEEFHTGEIFVVNLMEDSKTWGKPVKLNTEINNGGIANPKIYDDNRTIFYSRIEDRKDGWKIHWTKKLNEIHWYLPVMLDTLTSGHHEISPFYCKQDTSLYFIVYDDGGFNPEGAIFRHTLDASLQTDPTITISGNIVHPIDEDPVDAHLLVTDPVLKTIRFKTQTDSLGHYKMLLNASEDYLFHVWSQNHSHQYQLLEGANADRQLNFTLFDSIQLNLNVYDEEELWPLKGDIEVIDDSKNQVDIEMSSEIDGQVQFKLAIGKDYTIMCNAKDHYENELDMALSGQVLFDEFTRDIELKPHKRYVEIEVRDAETLDPLTANIDIYDHLNRRFLPDPLAGRIGTYSIELREGEPFDLEVRGPRGFAFKHEEIDLDKNRQLKRIEVLLQPLMVKVPIRLNNITFEYNSAELFESSFNELNRVVQLLIENPEIYVEIMAHTDDIGSERFNNVLAEKRANSVVDYLVIMGGIERERLVAKGYGETMPLVPNDTEENRSLNRRVEMRILDENDEDFLLEERLIKQKNTDHE